MHRGEVWTADVGDRSRPVVILTRDEVIDVRSLVVVAEITTKIRELSTEVALDRAAVGLAHKSVVNCDGLHTIAQSVLKRRVGHLDPATMDSVCRAVSIAIGCD